MVGQATLYEELDPSLQNALAWAESQTLKGARDLEDHRLPNSQLTEEATEAQGGRVTRHTSLQLPSGSARGHLIACFTTQPLRHHSRAGPVAGSRGADPALGEGTPGLAAVSSLLAISEMTAFLPSPLLPAACL